MIKYIYREKLAPKYVCRIDDYRRYVKMFVRNKEQFVNEWNGRQRKIKYGNENTKKTFFIIRREAPLEGLFSIFNYVMGGLYRAEINNYIPVVDLKNYYSIILQTEKTKGKENAWEYFFKQPADYSLEDISHSRKIILSDKHKISPTPDLYYDVENMNIKFWSKLYNKYIRYSNSVLQKLTDIEKELSFCEKRVLGITIRRGVEWGYLVGAEDYMTYPKPMDLNTCIELINNRLQEWNCDCVFVSIDDEEGVDILRKEFGNKLIVLERRRRTYFKNGLPINYEQKVKIEDAKYNSFSQAEKIDRETMYLIETILLSKCDSLIATKTSANTAALIMNGGEFKHIYQI